MSKKAAYSHDDKAVKQGISIPASVLAFAKEQSKLEHGGNLSRYLASLVDRDRDGGGQGRNASSPIIDFVSRVCPHLRDEAVAAFDGAPAEELDSIEKAFDEKLLILLSARELSGLESVEAKVAFLQAYPRHSALSWAKPLGVSQGVVATEVAKGLIDYVRHAKWLRKSDDGTQMIISMTYPGQPKFSDEEIHKRLLPVVVPSGVIEDMKKQIEELEARCRRSPETH